MATIEYKGYFVERMNYMENDNYDEDTEQLEIIPDFKADINFTDDEALVIFDIECGDSDNHSSPFILSIRLIGLFEYSVDKNSDEDKQLLQKLTTQNSIAILYPYLRSLVSDITIRSNRFPPFILPVINVVKMMEDNNAISVTFFDD